MCDVIHIIAGRCASCFRPEDSFDSNWKFHLGIVANAEQPEYNDSHWRVLDLPHDWSVEPLSFQKQGITTGPFSRMSEGDIDTGQTVGGEGWYRKELTLAGSDADKRIVLYFEGVYNQSELWINGKKLIIMFMDIPLIV